MIHHNRLFALTAATLTINAALASAAPVAKFGLITDSHHSTRTNSSTRFYSAALGKMDVFVNEMNTQGVNFVAELGDFKDTTSDNNVAATLGFTEQIESHYAAFNGPRYHVLGNHDTDCITRDDFVARTPNTGVSPSQTYYSVNHGGVHFVMLDGCFKSDGTAYSAGNYNWTDSKIPQAELDWLTADLQSANAPTMVFIHQRLDLADTISENVKNGSIVRSLLENDGQVMAVFSGHDHKGGLNTINGISYLTLKGNVEGGTDTLANNAFATVEVNQIDATTYGVNVQGYYREPSRSFNSTVVPEPATLGVALLGAIGSTLRRRRRA